MDYTNNYIYPVDNPDFALKDKVERLSRYHAVSWEKSDRETDDNYSIKKPSMGKTTLSPVCKQNTRPKFKHNFVELRILNDSDILRKFLYLGRNQYKTV